LYKLSLAWTKFSQRKEQHNRVTADESRLRHSANFAKVALATSAESLGYGGWTSSATLAHTCFFAW